MYDNNDTIVAIATPPGESGIGIVRISGKDALAIADKIFISKNGGRPSKYQTYTTHYGWIVENPGANRIDEVILTVMRAPRSFTKEDVVEINCHGGIVALRRALDLVLENGCRLASPGEFTKRAFLNGRIDLAQAEAVLDIIRAKTDSALKVGIEQLRGVLSGRVNKIRKILLDILSLLEANIDFPDEEIDTVNFKDVSQKLSAVKIKLNQILDTSRRGMVFREGIHVVICGKPNVGKSSLLNALLKKERSIVTPVAGTTRDTIEEIIDIKGIPIRIVDTAGIIEPADLVQEKAIQRSRRCMELADLVILVFDGNRSLSKEDRVLISEVKKKTVLAIINKIDLKQIIEKQKILKIFGRAIEISSKKFKNIESIEDAIVNLVYKGEVKSPQPIIVSNARHIEALKKTEEFVMGAVDSLDKKLSIEFIAQDVRDALGEIDRILGERFSEDLLDKIFSEFCIGK